ncbi:MAG TPA: guanylate kinase [Nitrospiraceae bacterium]|nr:guanylate kinase [Nitrospiraceae bacterium]
MTLPSNQPAVRPAATRRGILFVISAPSGTGKTTLCKQIASQVPGLWHSVSYTTRKPRPGEVNGREYFFVEEAVFLAMVERNEFVEWARVYGNLYGTPRKALADKMEQGIDVLLEIDVQGARTVRKKFEDGVYIFILPPSFEALRTRLQSRAGDSPDEIQRRLQKAKEEVWSYREYYYIVRNDDLKQSLKELESIFTVERIKTKRLNMTWLEDNFIKEARSLSPAPPPSPATKENPPHD